MEIIFITIVVWWLLRRVIVRVQNVLDIHTHCWEVDATSTLNKKLAELEKK